jgi:DNA invertase Pin-like site-specific DNA recombinase
MPTVHFYHRPLVNDTDADVSKRQQAMTEHFQRVLLPLGYAQGRVYLDAADTAFLEFRERPQGRELNLRLQRGDHVVIAGLEFIRNRHDLRATAHAWTDRGITFEILDVPALTTLGKQCGAILKVIDFVAEVSNAWLKDRCRRGRRTRKQRGKLANGSCGPGYRLIGRKRHRRKVVDEDERAVMRKIVEWHDKGASWRTLYFHLLKHRIKRRGGREWSEMAIRRAYDAEKQLREQETPATPDAPDGAPDSPGSTS